VVVLDTLFERLVDNVPDWEPVFDDELEFVLEGDAAVRHPY